MKVTTVRFGEDLWRLLDGEAERLGISVSQYIREAALARAAAGVAARGADPVALLGQMSSATNSEPAAEASATETPAELAIRHADELWHEGMALIAESQQTVRHRDELIRRRDEMIAERRAQRARRDAGE